MSSSREDAAVGVLAAIRIQQRLAHLAGRAGNRRLEVDGRHTVASAAMRSREVLEELDDWLAGDGPAPQRPPLRR